MKYLMLAYTGAAGWDDTSISQEDVARICREYGQLEARLKDSGEWVASEGLADHSQTVTVRPKDGDTVVTDGAYLDAKETIVSYVLVDVETHERAVEIARELVSISGETCEVRPVMEMDLPLDIE